MTFEKSIEARIQQCVDRYAFDPSQKRDADGRWKLQSGAEHNANEFNQILAKHGHDPLKVVKHDTVHQTEEGRFGVRKDQQRFAIENVNEDEFGEEEYKSLVEESEKLDRANAILEKHGHELEELDDDGETAIDPDELEEMDQGAEMANAILAHYPELSKAEIVGSYLKDPLTGKYDMANSTYELNVDLESLEEAHQEVQKANEILSKFPDVEAATIEEEMDSYGNHTYTSTIDPDELSDAVKELKKVNKILAIYGAKPATLISDDDSIVPSVVTDDLYEMHDTITKLNKRLTSMGMQPNLKLTIEDGEPYASHDLYDIENALDTLKAFRPKKGSTETNEPEKYSRRTIGDAFQARLILRDFMPDRYSEGTWKTINGAHVEVDEKGQITKGPKIGEKKEKVPEAPAWFKGGKKSTIQDHFQAAMESRKDPHSSISSEPSKTPLTEQESKRSKTTIQEAAAELKKKGYQLGKGDFDLKEKRSSYDVTHPNGETKKLTPDQIHTILEEKPPVKEPDQNTGKAKSVQEAKRVKKLAEKGLDMQRNPIPPATVEKIKTHAQEAFRNALGLLPTKPNAIADFEARLKKGVENYAKKSADNEPVAHKFSSTQINLPQDLTDKIRAMAATIPGDDLAEEGRETAIHCTVKYGLHTDDPDDVRNALKESSPIHVVLGATSLFENPDADVLKIDVKPMRDVENLWKLNRMIADGCENTETWPDYKPHVTLAYLKPGTGKKYIGMDDVEDESFKVSSLDFSDKLRQMTTIELGQRIPDEVLRDEVDFFSRIESARHRYGTGEQWITIGARSDGEDGKKHGGTPVRINADGKIDAGAPSLKGEKLDSIGDRFRHHVRSAKAAHAKADGKTGRDYSTKQAEALGTDRKVAHHQAAKEASRGTGIAAHRIMQAMPEAHQHLTAINEQREQAKAELRKTLDMTSTQAAIHENREGKDHSSVKNFDTASRDIAERYPDLGFDPNSTDTPAKVWELLREGKGRHIAEHDPEVAKLAAEWLKGTKPTKASERVRESGDEEYDELATWQRSEHPSGKLASEVIPFSRSMEERISYAKLFNEDEHPRGQPTNGGQFSQKTEEAFSASSKVQGRKNKINEAMKVFREATDDEVSHAADHATGPIKDASHQEIKNHRPRLHFDRMQKNMSDEKEAQQQSEDRLNQQMDDADKILKIRGFTLDHQSGNSRYYSNGKTGVRVRISDHYVPETDERRHSSKHGGFSWATSGNNIVLPVENVESSLSQIMKPEIYSRSDAHGLIGSKVANSSTPAREAGSDEYDDWAPQSRTEHGSGKRAKNVVPFSRSMEERLDYAKRKSAPGQRDLFSGDVRSSGSVQSRLQWDESKVKRDENGEFAKKSESVEEKLLIVDYQSRNPSLPSVGVSGASKDVHYAGYGYRLRDVLASMIHDAGGPEGLVTELTPDSRINVRYNLGISPEDAAKEIFNDLAKPRIDHPQMPNRSMKEIRKISEDAVNKIKAENGDPLALTLQNVEASFDANVEDVVERNPKLSLNMCRSLAAARILNAVGKASAEYQKDIDRRVKNDELVSDEEDDKYMVANDLRKKLFDPLVRMSGYRPGAGDEDHEEAKRPLVGFGKGDSAKSEPKRDSEGRIIHPTTGQVQALPGGEHSEVTGNFHKGGSWMPVHGLTPKAEKKPEGNGDSSAGKSDEGKKQPTERKLYEPRVMSVEDIETERQRREEKRQWEEVKDGPLGRLMQLGEMPGKVFSTGGNKQWYAFADDIGKQKIDDLADTLESEVRSLTKKDLQENPWKLRNADSSLSEEEAMKNFDDYNQMQEQQTASYMTKKSQKEFPKLAKAHSLMDEWLSLNGDNGIVKLHQWMSGKKPISQEPQSIESFADHVHQLAHAAPSHEKFYDNKAFIGPLWKASQSREGFPEMTKDEFQKTLVKANGKGLLNLGRADMVSHMNPELVKDSETNHLNAQFHFVILPDKKSQYSRSVEDRIQYAKKPASGQSSFNFDEEKHPRDDKGEFAKKNEASTSSRAETHFRGDRAEYTGNQVDGMHEIEMMEGIHKGTKKLTSRAPDGTNPEVEKRQDEWKQQQDEFRQLAASQKKQSGLFSRQELTGEKQLFDTGKMVFEPKKSTAKKTTESSLLEKIDDEQKAKELKPIEGQKDLFSRLENAKIAYTSKIGCIHRVSNGAT